MCPRVHCLPCVRPRSPGRDQGSHACHHSRAVQPAGASMRLHMTGNGLHPMRAAALRPALRPACSAVSRAGKILPPRRMAADFSELDDDALLELWWAAAEQGDTQRLKDIAGAEPNIINLVRMHCGATTAHAHAHARARAHAHTHTHTHTHAHTQPRRCKPTRRICCRSCQAKAKTPKRPISKTSACQPCTSAACLDRPLRCVAIVLLSHVKCKNGPS